MENHSLSNWEGWAGTPYLRVSDVISEQEAFLVMRVESEQDPRKLERLRIKLTLSNAGKSYFFTLNRTNLNFIIGSGMCANPMQMQGCKLYFRKVKAFNLQRVEVDALRVVGISR